MTIPTLILIDIQREYFTPGRPFFLEGGTESLEAARAILHQARDSGFNVIHVQHMQDGPVFSKDSEFSRFVEGFEPAEGEQLFVKSQLAAYTNEAYGRLIEMLKSGPLYVVGYGSSMCCLATIVTGASLGHKYTLIEDASWARSPGNGIPEEAMHRHMVAAIRIHGAIAQSSMLLSPKAA